MINTNPLPKNARISVLVMVPTMSRPMFMPERKRSLPLRSGATVCTSVRAEDMLMATSITAPRALMTTPATNRPRRPRGVPVCRSCSSGSTSVRRRPSMRSRPWASRPNSSARAVPAMVPSAAQTVLLLTPPRITMVTTVIYAQTRNTVSSVGAPFISRGIITKNRHTSVTARATRDFAPTLPPTATVASKNRPTITARPTARSYSYTVAVWLPSE